MPRKKDKKKEKLPRSHRRDPNRVQALGENEVPGPPLRRLFDFRKHVTRITAYLTEIHSKIGTKSCTFNEIHKLGSNNAEWSLRLCTFLNSVPNDYRHHVADLIEIGQN